MKRTPLLLLPAVGLLGSLASAQTASALLREGDVLVGAPAGQVVTSLSGTDANTNFGYVVQVNSSDGTTSLSHAWGTGDGSSPAILQTEGVIGALTQTSFEGFLGISDAAQVAYSASGTGGPAGGFDSVWLDSTPLAVEGDPILTLPGEFWRFASRPGVTADGIPYFVGGITSTSGGSTQDYGLFYGLNPTVVLRGGDVVPNLPESLDTASTVSFDYRFSSLGTNHLVEVKMAGASVSTTNDNAMVFSGQGLMLGGGLVQEDTVIPVSVGGNGTEAWDNFDYFGVTESGQYVFSGDTSGDVASDEIIVIDGTIAYREGDTVDGEVLTGSIEGVSMNEAGTVVYIWDIVEGTGDVEALFAADTLLLREGDAVDWDGDGIIDPAVTIVGFTGIASLSLGSDTVVYFTADVDDAGNTLEGLFAIQAPSSMTPFCYGDGSGTPCPCVNDNDGSLPFAGCANGVFTSGAQLYGSGAPSLSGDTVVLHGAFSEPNNSGLFFQANNDLSPGIVWGDGLQCTGGALKRLQVRFADAAGSSATTVGISAKAGNINPGDTKYYQLWYRNPANPPCGAGVHDFNASNGLAITWTP